MSGTSITITGLEVVAGGQTILGPLDLEVAAGEYVCLLGHSGSGKSTLLRAIAGLQDAVRGTILLGSEKMCDSGKQLVAPEKRAIGMLFQEGALWPHMSVEKTLHFALRACGVPRSARAARVTELLQQVRLPGFEKRKPATLSGGEAQRVALARALAPNPKLLLLDEPLGPLDTSMREELCDSLKQLHSDLGFTALHVTHDPSEAERIGARQLRINAGRLEGSTA